MTFSEVVEAHGGQAALAKALGVNKSYISRAARKPQIGYGLAIRILDKTGHKIGPIEGATPEQIEALRSVSLRDA